MPARKVDKMAENNISEKEFDIDEMWRQCKKGWPLFPLSCPDREEVEMVLPLDKFEPLTAKQMHDRLESLEPLIPKLREQLNP